MSHNGNTVLMEALYEEALEETEVKFPSTIVDPATGLTKAESEAEKIARKKFEDSEFSGNASWSLS